MVMDIVNVKAFYRSAQQMALKPAVSRTVIEMSTVHKIATRTIDEVAVIMPLQLLVNVGSE